MGIDDRIAKLQAQIAAREAADMQSLLAQIEIKRVEAGDATFESANAALDKLQALVTIVENMKRDGDSK